MKERKVHEILQIIRTEKGIPQDKLSYGLCTKGAYSKYEYGERIPDRLLLNVLIQRLGKNPDKLETILSKEEYEYFFWKKEVLTALCDGDMVTTGKLLQEPEAITIVINEGLQKQFWYQVQAIVVESTGQPSEKCIELLEQAVELTMPGIRENSMEEYLISAEEMELVLELSEFLIKGKREQEAMELLPKILSYVEKNYDDYEMKVKIYPRAVKVLVPLLYERERKTEGMALCKKAIELLCWQGVLFDLTELMEWYLKCNEGLPQTEEAVRYEKQLQALKEVYQEYHAESYQSENARMTYSNRELYLIDEVIRRSRTNQELSQEKLSEDICTPETLSRIESGKRAPSTKNFRALMKKLDTDLDYYNGELDTNDFLLLEKKLELNRAISLKNWGEAEEIVAYLKERLDMSRAKNQRILRAEENCILFNQGKLAIKEFLKACEQAMGCEGESWREEKFWKQFFTRYKVTIMNHMACIYSREHKRKDSIFILEHLLKQFLDSKIELSDRYKSSEIVVGNLSSYYGEEGDLEKCLEMCKMGMDICLRSGRGIGLGKFLGNRAEALDNMEKSATEKSRKYLEWSYYISDLFSAHRTVAYTDSYYRTHYKKDIKWY